MSRKPIENKIRLCKHCCKEFESPTSRQQFCSRECVASNNRSPRGHATYRTCKTEFEYRKRSSGPRVFCSIECLAKSKVTHKGAKTHKGWYCGQYRSVETRACEYCGNRFNVPPSSRQTNCSLSCASQKRTDDGFGKVRDEKVDYTKHLGLLTWMVRGRIKSGPIEGTDEYQSAWVGLLIACETYRGGCSFSTHAIACMREQIFEDLGGRQSTRIARRKLRDEGCRSNGLHR